MTRTTTKTQSRRAVGYVRISALMGRTQGEDLLSDVIQRERIEAWARFRGARVVGWYEDIDVSGRKGVRRPEFDRMVADAMAGKFDTVIVYRLSRFARNVRGALEALDELEGRGVTLVSVSEDLDTSTATGKLLRTVLLAMDEFQSDLIGESWRHVHANRRGRGIAHVATGLLGYDTSRDLADGSKVQGARIVGVKTDDARAVRLAYEMSGDGYGYAAIRDRLHAEGFRPARGGEWFAASTLSQMLRNPTYAGLLRMPDGELVRAAHEPVVPLDLWERVQTRPKKALRTRRANDGTSFLVGLVFCAGCGTRMKFQRRGDRPPVFRCWARQRSRSCPTPGQSILARQLEEHVVEQLLLNRASFERARATASATDAESAERLRSRDGDVGRMIERLTARIARTDDDLVGAEYERQLRELVSERATIAELLADIEPEAASRRVPSLDEWSRLSLEEKRVGVGGLIRRLVVSKAASQGGRRDRGIDFAQRVRFVLEWEWSSAWESMGRLLDEDDVAVRVIEGIERAGEASSPIVLEQ
jgi:site-specific DNA recombinase